jgi:hypothetical protein
MRMRVCHGCSQCPGDVKAGVRGWRKLIILWTSLSPPLKLPLSREGCERKATVANRTREIRLSGMKRGAWGNVAYGGTVNPPRNRKGGIGNPPPNPDFRSSLRSRTTWHLGSTKRTLRLWCGTSLAPIRNGRLLTRSSKWSDSRRCIFASGGRNHLWSRCCRRLRHAETCHHRQARSYLPWHVSGLRRSANLYS